jgi:hypothetical protein
MLAFFIIYYSISRLIALINKEFISPIESQYYWVKISQNQHQDKMLARQKRLAYQHERM